ncbi:hypothetical protein [Streptomyces spectabilis]|uniref:Uncharacterized protein n=1 Tax=Streptomyces spectabilis TaxID=68270 RepID=A0A5P2XLR6_STRST|nr:hypothetical protein [Streptomyces spectabilis]MBB5102447.1 hypothetical protein [Streptomyces spectabilis]MCI3907489.1 hypothetical protein [Streptomyces spectabilis]QEV64189.1 hypothetical protein CP982_40445 [Streptomyces spectabilis]GGV31781.1 hypothetical protein GCM10010245_51550 [Streptomyces spectabilis]
MTTTRMKAARVGRAALAAAAALAVFTALPTSTAHAADGIFFYHSPESGDLEIEDPDNGECYLLLQGADAVYNDTDTEATVYYDHGCEEAAETLEAGEERGYFEPLPHSVKFG